MHEVDLRKVAELQADAETKRQTRIDNARALIQSMRIEVNTEMPPPSATGFKSSCRVDLESNVFGVRIENERTIYRYDVFIEAEIGTKGKRVEFTKKGNTDYLVSDRNKKCITAFSKLVKQASFYRPERVFFYDGQAILYTVEKLELNDKTCETVIMEGSQICDEFSPFNYVHFSVKPCSKNFQCQLSDVRMSNRDSSKKDRSAVQFCDIATTMNSVYRNPDRFTIFKDGKIFPNRPDLEGLK
ncbi:hypothetical protein PFISCL1PPCAC_19756, partial [Pristionchus fissidentatus]